MGMDVYGKAAASETEAEALADAVLKAAGSGLRHYSMAKTREAIIAAAQKGIDESRAELLETLTNLAEQADEDCPSSCRTRHFCDALEDAHNAIAKATGKEAA